MGKIIFGFLLCIFSTISLSSNNDKCSSYQKYTLSVFEKNDITFLSKNCVIDPQTQYVKNFFELQKKKIFINKLYGRIGNGSGVELKAVSIYRKSKEPILITLYTENYCCYPQPSGILYTVELHKITKKDKKIVLKSITNILGDNSSGLEGVSDDYLHYELKNISLIKEWLDKNYY